MLVRFETIEPAAQQQADALARLARSAGGDASIVPGEDEGQLWNDHRRRPWDREGAVIKITLLPNAVGSLIAWLAESAGGADYEVVGRAGVGVLLARVGGDAERQARVLTGLRQRLPVNIGSAVLVRGSEDLRGRVDSWGPMGDGLSVMRAIKQQFDPLGILNPGRGPGGL